MLAWLPGSVIEMGPPTVQLKLAVAEYVPLLTKIVGENEPMPESPVATVPVMAPVLGVDGQARRQAQAL